MSKVEIGDWICDICHSKMNIKKVGKNVFMCAPNNVSVNFTEELKKPSSSTTMPWEE